MRTDWYSTILSMEVAGNSETTSKVHGVRYHKISTFILMRMSNVTEFLYIIIIVINFRSQGATGRILPGSRGPQLTTRYISHFPSRFWTIINGLETSTLPIVCDFVTTPEMYAVCTRSVFGAPLRPAWQASQYGALPIALPQLHTARNAR
jgi:hypothetical protein